MDIRLFIKMLTHLYATHNGAPHPLAEKIRHEVLYTPEINSRDLNREIIYYTVDRTLTLILPDLLDAYKLTRTGEQLRGLRGMMYPYSPNLLKDDDGGIFSTTDFPCLTNIGAAGRFWREEADAIKGKATVKKFDESIAPATGRLRTAIEVMCAAETEARRNFENYDDKEEDTFFSLDPTGDVFTYIRNYSNKRVLIGDLIDVFVELTPKQKKSQALRNLSALIYELWEKYNNFKYQNFVLNLFFSSIGWPASFYSSAASTLEEQVRVLGRIIEIVDAAFSVVGNKTKYKIERSIDEAKNMLAIYPTSSAAIMSAAATFGEIVNRIIELADDPQTVIDTVVSMAEEI